MKLTDKGPGGVSWIMVGLLAFAVPAQTNAATQDLQVTPNRIHLGIFFHGAEVTISGEIPEGYDAIVEVTGKALNEHFMRKGRRAGLWMNVGELRIQGLPNLYMCMGHTPRPSHSSHEALGGYEALKERAIFSGDIKESEFNQFFEQFVLLKENEGLYKICPDSLKTTRSSGGSLSLEGTLQLPAKLQPGTYDVCLTVHRNGQVLRRECVPFQVVMVGFPAVLSVLAYHHGLLYGILAVVIAIAVGFLMGFLFKGKSGH
jgi:uncharacterized protein (TIGR02186 family)